MTSNTDSIISPNPPRRSWTATRWTIVAGLHDALEVERKASWEYLEATYRAPMVSYVRSVLRRITGSSKIAQDAEEVVQDFLANCFEKAWLSRADPDRGTFRAFTKRLLYVAAIGHLRKLNRIKEAGGPGVEFFEIRDDDRIDDLTPEEQAEVDEFDRSWFKTTFDHALKTLEEKRPRYHTVIRDLLDNDGVPSADLGERVQAVRNQQFSLVLHRSRKRFREILGKELSQTVKDQKGLDEEYETLIRFLLG